MRPGDLAPRPRGRWPRPRAVLGLAALPMAMTMAMGALGLALVAPRPVLAEPPQPPPYYAIRDARVVTGTGRTLERATVLLADGLIAAVGPDLEIPADAWVVEGKGLTVFPGFIDALTNIGLAAEDGKKGAAGNGTHGGPEIRGPEDRPATTPWVSAADLQGEDRRVETWRRAGFTSAVTAPDEGLFSGQAALIDLGRVEPRGRVVATPVAQRLSFKTQGGFRRYPGSLMGVLSYIEQTLSDARHDAAVEELYARDPKGRERPEYDRTLAPLQEALANDLPFLMPGNLPREIDRVLAIREQYQVHTVLYGGQGAYDRADRLKAAGVAVLVSLDWPHQEADQDPQETPSLATLAYRRLAPTTPGVLAAAGVPFAFTSDGLASPSEVFANLRRALADGLSAEAALTALTSGAARIFGVGDRLGTIEPGKIANLVVATAAPWEEGAKIEAVFVDGRETEVPAPEPTPEKRAEEPPAEAEAGEGKPPAAEKGASPVSPEELRRALAVYRGPVRRMGSYAITHATVWTVTGETLPDATVVVANGKIRAVGREVPIPPGAEVIDAGGGHLIPGIIDCHSHIAIEGGVNEGTLAVTAMVGVGDVIDPDDIAIYRALAGGVTTADLLHGSANPIGGKNAVVKLRWGSDARGLLFRGAPPGIKLALGENPKRSNFRVRGGAERYPATRMGVMDVIREAFTEARRYQRTWKEYRAAQARGESPTPPRRDFKLDALVEVLEGKRLVHAHSYRADEILQLMRLAEELGFRVATFQHGLEGYKVADEIAAHGAGVSTFSDWWGYKMEAYDAIPFNAALLTRRGVVVSINSDSAEEMRHLNQEAAKSIHWGGLTELEALEMVTINPAIQLGIADRVGSIEPGKDADLVLYDGDPLSALSVVEKTFVDGDLYFDRGADRERQALVDDISQRLLVSEQAEQQEKKKGKGAGGKKRHRPAPASAGAASERYVAHYVRSRDALWEGTDDTYTCREDR